MPINKTKFCIEIEKFDKDRWSFCLGLSHWEHETYLYINLFRWCITIGKIYKYPTRFDAVFPRSPADCGMITKDDITQKKRRSPVRADVPALRHRGGPAARAAQARRRAFFYRRGERIGENLPGQCGHQLSQAGVRGRGDGALCARGGVQCFPRGV